MRRKSTSLPRRLTATVRLINGLPSQSESIGTRWRPANSDLSTDITPCGAWNRPWPRRHQSTQGSGADAGSTTTQCTGPISAEGRYGWPRRVEVQRPDCSAWFGIKVVIMSLAAPTGPESNRIWPAAAAWEPRGLRPCQSPRESSSGTVATTPEPK